MVKIQRDGIVFECYLPSPSPSLVEWVGYLAIFIAIVYTIIDLSEKTRPHKLDL